MAHPPTQPGIILNNEHVELGLTARVLARHVNVPANRTSQIIQAKRAKTGDMALDLGHWFGNSPQFWLNLLSQHDLRVAEAEAGKRFKNCQRGRLNQPSISFAKFSSLPAANSNWVVRLVSIVFN
jgi:antitoxin HigA-1